MMAPKLFACIILCLYASSCEADDTLIINKITKIENNQMRIHYTIEPEGGYKTITDPVKWHLNIWISGDKPEQTSLYQAKMEDGSCDFDVDLQNGAQDIIFILAGQNKDDVDLITTQISLTLPSFPVDLDSIAMWVGSASDIALRVGNKAITDGFIYDKKECKESGSICYYVDVTRVIDKAIEICNATIPTPNSVLKSRIAEQGSIDVCDLTQTIADAEADTIFGTGAVPNEAEISYTKDDEAEITIKRDSDVFELVVYRKTEIGSNIIEDSVTVCATEGACTVERKKKDDTYTIMMVGYESSKSHTPKDSTIHSLKDYDVVGTGLTSTLIETRWSHQDGSDKYLVSTTGTAAFTSTTVTCEKSEKIGADYHCFGYFTGLTANTAYPLTTQTTDDNGKNPDDQNKVTLKETKTKPSEGMELKISNLNTKWHKGLRSFEVNACVHEAETLSNHSHYEAILINKRGQWKKAHGFTNRIGNQLCFDALDRKSVV